MKARNRITLIAIIFFSCLLVADCYIITDILIIQLKPVQLRLQIINTEDDDTNHNNSFAEFPENDISFDIYSKLSDSKSDILQHIIYEFHFQRNPDQYSGSTHNINLNHLIICNLDLPPPFFSQPYFPERFNLSEILLLYLNQHEILPHYKRNNAV